ncbi:Z1 domain-containing protein [Candidatus Halocynthiibacter alkanivorans]|uniref:Z1 domain-containing protein n=1 Tax=Candidatus Halocynthiibacter alkanivorans TaxID=2267619 RepID=UPI00190F742A|nr:Z1 domain-containing protein [Candidatus Halocynthiibacter alkanivorans]
MGNQIGTLDNMVSQGLAEDGKRTPEGIRELITALRDALFKFVTDEQVELLARDIEERIGVSMGLGAIVDDADFKPWLNDAKSTIKPYYWDRYKKLLVSNKLPPDVITGTDEVTDRILGRLGNPQDPASWYRRGMVVGHVQSGKTANYTGLICKAADAGYRLIVVIAGIHNNLRNQTQARIDEGFIGRDTGRLAMVATRNKPKKIGVGLYDDRGVPVSLTNTIKDFNKATATSNTSQIASYSVPVVLVIKKNTHTLKNLIEWLREYSAGGAAQMIDQPMLLIDDEADNASINVKYGKDEVSKINSQIRDLLSVFRRSCYVGYTATPFANIFIDPDQDDDLLKEDLFPRNFIIGLDAPKNYFGPTKVFLDGIPEEGEPTFLRYITDNEDVLPIKHRIDLQVDVLPVSMVQALRAFIVARTIRNLRGQSHQNASMLVNSSRFTGVQGIIRNRLHEALETITNAVRVYGSLGADGLREPEISALHDVWEQEYAESWPEWASIQNGLLDTLAAAKVVEVNSRNNGLDYDEAGERGLTVIIVGGFSLSRGLTLEGLTVSYFLRNSLMYDTLMQMGRWFGYRGGYEDLCRIWMPYQAVGWYSHIAEATNELHEELKRMERAKATPEMFGLAVRSHPSALLVTARNKMGSGEKHVRIGLSNGFVETTKLTNRDEVLDRNRMAARNFLGSLDQRGFTQETAEHGKGGYLLRDVPVEIIDDLLLKFQNDRDSIRTDTRPIRQYIEARAEDELSSWDVFVISVKENDTERLDNSLGWILGPADRSVGTEELKHSVLAISGSRSRVASRGIEKIGLSANMACTAEADFLAKSNFGAEDKVNFPDGIYRSVRHRPLFLLYLLKVRAPKGEEDKIEPGVLPDEPVVAWGISFPRSARPDERVEYIMNTTKLREMFGDDDDDEDEGTYDDE